MSKAEPQKITTAEGVLAALRRRYTSPEYALFENVGNATGHRANRYADALAMAVWPSRGLLFHGFEIKVNRNDVLRELKDPKKADDIARYCDFWWMAVGDAKIVKSDELPPTWGLLVPTNGKGGATLKIVKDASRLKPKAIDRSFIAAILRRAAANFDPAKIRDALSSEVYSQIHETLSAALDRQYEAQIKSLTEKLEQASVRQAAAEKSLQAALGLGYDVAVVKRAIDLLHRLGNWDGAHSRIERVLSDLDRGTQSLATARESITTSLELVEILAGKKIEATIWEGDRGFYWKRSLFGGAHGPWPSAEAAADAARRLDTSADRRDDPAGAAWDGKLRMRHRQVER